MAIDTTIRPHVKDRRLYILAAVFIPVIVLAGFARTYYLKGLFETPALPSLLVHLHGIVMTSWVVLFVVQVSLVAKRRVRVHQRLGVFGAMLAALIVVVGTLTGIAGAARGSSPGPPPLQFLVVPLGATRPGLIISNRCSPRVEATLPPHAGYPRGEPGPGL